MTAGVCVDRQSRACKLLLTVVRAAAWIQHWQLPWCCWEPAPARTGPCFRAHETQCSHPVPMGGWRACARPCPALCGSHPRPCGLGWLPVGLEARVPLRQQLPLPLQQRRRLRLQGGGFVRAHSPVLQPVFSGTARAPPRPSPRPALACVCVRGAREPPNCFTSTPFTGAPSPTRRSTSAPA